MAEKYGEIPKRFTKAWWDYCAYYYKWHVIITLAAVIIAAVTIVQCATRTRYDMTVVYAGHKNYSEEEISCMQEVLSEYITDIDENGEKNVMLMPLMFVDNPGSEEYDYAIQTKLDMSFTDKYTYVYLMDRQEAELYLNRENIADTFEDVTAFVPNAFSEVLYAPDGTGYAVSLSDSTLMKNNDIYCDDLFVLVAKSNNTDEKSALAHEDALFVARKLTVLE